MPYQEIKLNYSDNVATITLNQPDVLNAMSKSMGAELIDALKVANVKSRAIVLGSVGRAFCAGANLGSGGLDINSKERDAGAGLATVFNPLICTIRDLDVPFITAVRGAAAGIGCPIALMGDIIIAGKSAYFLQAFRNIGLIPDGGSAYILARTIGRVKAMEMMLLGKKFLAIDALHHGLITQLVEDSEVDKRAAEIALELSQGPTKTFGLLRKSAWAALDSTLEEQLNRERDFQREAGMTEDFVEGVTAFREKRKANFQGK